MYRLFFLALFLTVVSPLFGEGVSGLVFEDSNRNGVKDRGEIGLAGVVVTDGFNLTKSDSRGQFKLEVKEDRAKFIYVTTPNGYEPIGAFYRWLDSSVEGSKSNRKYLFSLAKSSAKNSEMIVHISDSEARIYRDWIDRLKEFTQREKPAAIIFSGDICYTKGLLLHKEHINEKSMGCRVVFSLGNHDLVDGKSGEELYENSFGPAWYSFDMNGVHFVNLPVLSGDRKPSYSPYDIYSWLKKDLESIPEGMPVAIIDHHLVGAADNFRYEAKDLVVDMADYNFKAYIYGHYHTNLFRQLEGGPQLICSMSPNKGGIDHSAASFRLLNFSSKGEFKSKLRYTQLKNHIVANSYRYRDSLCISVTAYDSNSNVDSVSLLLGDSKLALSAKNLSTWSGSIALNELPNSRSTLSVRAYFADGDVGNALVSEEDEIKRVISLPTNIMFAAPIISGDTLFVAAFDDDGEGKSGIYALNRDSGDLLWFFESENSLKNSIVLENSTLYAADVNSTLYAVDAKSGLLKWRRELTPKGVVHPVYTQGIAFKDGAIFAGQGANLQAVDALSGDLIWKNSDWYGGVNGVNTNLLADTVLVTSGYWKGRYAHSSNSGKLLWKKQDDENRSSDSDPIYVDGKLIYTTPNYLLEVDPVSGKEITRVKLNCVVNSKGGVSLSDSIVVVGSSDKGLFGYNRAQGYKEMWNFKTNPALIYTIPYSKDFQMTIESKPIFFEDMVLFGANDGYLYAIDPIDGSYRFRLNCGMPILSQLVISGDELFVTTFSGDIFIINLNKL